MEVFQILGAIISNLKELLQSFKIFHNITWWNVYISYIALRLGIYLFKLMFADAGTTKEKGGKNK